MRKLLVGLCIALAGLSACGASPEAPAPPARGTSTAAAGITSSWPHYGGELTGNRFAAIEELSPQKIDMLKPVWTFRTGDASDGRATHTRPTSFKATPILLDGKLIVSTGFNRVIAVDPLSGAEIWRFDPKIDFSDGFSEMFTSRGVAGWTARRPVSECPVRVFLGTLDARLMAIDGVTGRLCNTFGKDGEVDLSRGIKNFRRGEYSLTSPVTVANGVLIVGSSIGDNGGARLDNGAVRGFDAITGKKIWTWDPIPKDMNAGAGNMWSVAAADPKLGLVYLPMTSPSPDFYGGERRGDNGHANSVAALDIQTGKLKWAYKIVRHDIWDYDLAAQPTLVDLPIDGKIIPALAQATKMGFVFVLDRRTGEPIGEVEDRAVPQSGVPGEQTAPNQKFPKLRLHPTDAKDFKRWAISDDHKKRCDQILAGVRYDGIFTPPSLEGSLLFPGNPGGIGWGAMAAHPGQSTAFTIVNSLPTLVRLIPRKDFRAQARTGLMNGREAQFTAQSGTPYGMARFDVFDADANLPCHAGPWSKLVAMDLITQTILWERPIGFLTSVKAGPIASAWGRPNSGGPIVTAGGVVFAASGGDRSLRGYDAKTGEVAWEATLPAQIHATPMAYQINGRSFVVVAAGGAQEGTDMPGDYLAAFELGQD